MRTCGLAALCIGLVSTTAFARQRPEVGYVYPPGGRAGTTVKVRVGGYDFTPDTQFFVRDERVELKVLGPPGEMLHPGPPHWFGPRALNSNKPFPVPREVPARLRIPADMPAGVIRWQAANANGASTTGEFVVSRGPQEVLEDDCPAVGDRPARGTQPVVRELPPLPLTLSGRLEKKEEVDRYRLVAEKTGLVTCTLSSHKLGSPLNAVVEIEDSSGRRIGDAADTIGNGLGLTFEVQVGEPYTLVLYDLDYRGDRSMVYRLTLAQAPRVLAAVPAAGRRGETRRVRFIGYGLATGKARLESTVRHVTFPDALAAADAGAFSYGLETPFGTAAPFELRVGDHTEAVEPDQAGDAPCRIDAPGAVTGVLDDRFGGDQYLLPAKKGQRWRIDAWARRIGPPLDIELTILDADGTSVAVSDDLPGTTDAGLLFEVPADGEYRIVVRDISGGSGSRASVYRVSVSAATPGFRLSVPERAETIPGAERVEPPTKRRNRGKEQPGLLTIDVVRQGGFQGRISVTLSGVPPGISLPEEIIVPAKATSVSVPIPCDGSAASFASLVTVHAAAKREDGTSVEDRAAVLVTPVLKPRALVRPLYPDAGRTVYRGATYPAPVVLERLEGYTGEVELQMASHPDRVRQGIRGDAVVVPSGVDEIEFPLFLPEWVQTDRTSRIALNTVVKVPDGQGNVRHLVNRMDRRITMNVEGALLKVTAGRKEFPMDSGKVDIPVKLLRSPRLSGPVRLRLHHKGEGERLFDAEPVVVSPGLSDARLTVVATGGEPPPGEHALTLEASALRDGHPVISRTAVFVQTK